MNSTRTERSGLLCVETPAPRVQRTYMETDFANLAAQVHKKDTGCDGPLTIEGAAYESSNAVVLPFLCCGCGANFGRVHIGGTSSLSTTLGILLAGDSVTGWSASCQYSDQKVMDASTFAAQQRVVLRHVLGRYIVRGVPQEQERQATRRPRAENSSPR